jgi:hypothetical protein
VEIRKILCSTNAIESLNARYRRAVKARRHFPTEQAAMKCLYLVPIPRPQRHRSDTMGCALEASPERLRNHLRRPDADEDQLIMKPPLTRLVGQTPCVAHRISKSAWGT